MKDKDIIKAVGNIDDKFIEEAAPADSKIVKFRKPVKFNTTKFVSFAASFLVVALAGSLLLGPGMGVKKGAAYKEKEYYDGSSRNLYSAQDTEAESHKKADADSDETNYSEPSKQNEKGTSITDPAGNIPANVKLIYTATIDLQTVKFDDTITSLKDLVASFDGYFESQYIQSDSSKYTYRNANFTIRVPEKSYQDFIAGAGKLATLIGQKESVDDVGTRYFETEQRLQTLYTKEARLQELLAEAKNLSDIITLEKELSETEYSIDYYKSELNRYDSLVSYSTVHLNLYEVSNPESGVSKDNSFFARLGRAFKESFVNALDAIENAIIWASENFVALVILAVIVIILIKFKPFAKLYKKIRHLE